MSPPLSLPPRQPLVVFDRGELCLQVGGELVADAATHARRGVKDTRVPEDEVDVAAENFFDLA